MAPLVPDAIVSIIITTLLRASTYLIMSWFHDSTRTWLESIAIQVLKCGPIPRHVAFIMDGSRRYARKNKLDNVVSGHSKGFDRLTETLEWCNDLGIEEVTVYAFSIENFKRSKEEVDGLMSLATDKFEQLMKEREKLVEKNVRVKILGDLSLLPLNLQKSLAEVVHFTKDHSGPRLNVCFAYTSRQELTSSVDVIARGVKGGHINSEDVNEDLIDHCSWSHGCSKPDLLVRTSGEIRLSDFLLWQTSHSVIAVSPTLWPDFTIWDLMKAVFYYQRNIPELVPRESGEIECNENVKNFKSHVKMMREENIQRMRSSLA